MEKPLPTGQVSLFLKLLLNHLFATRVSYDKAFKSVTTRYGFSRWIMPHLYRLGYNFVMNYYAIRWLSSRRGYGTRAGGVVDFFVRRGLSLRELLEEVRDEASSLTPVKRISIVYSYPEFLVRSLLSRLNQGFVENMLYSLNERKRWLRINTLVTTVIDALKCLEETGVDYEVSSFLPYVVRIKKRVWEPIGRNKCLSQGLVIPQDLSSALVVESLKPLKSPFLDACSSPGVKLSHVIALSGWNLRIVAVDISFKRITVEKEFLAKTRAIYPGLILINADASSLESPTGFKQCLVDAPCSGLGVVYSDPAVKLNVTQNKISYYSNLQLSILKKMISVCDEVIFVTCSIHPGEGEEVVEKIISLSSERVRFRKLRYDWLREAYPGYVVSKNTYRIYPHLVGGSGFYLAYIERD